MPPLCHILQILDTSSEVLFQISIRLLPLQSAHMHSKHLSRWWTVMVVCLFWDIYSTRKTDGVSSLDGTLE